MPIYAYRCSACGHAKDVLQKLSDPLLTTCPACGAQTFAKQVTAAGFQLKGSGWYVTDFRGGNSAAAKAGDDKPADGKPADGKPASADAAPAADAAAATPMSTPASAAAPAAPTPSAGSAD
ncbi:MAG TPA: zinc ribbon domain-containing protein [Rubrivivax sp.]|nr:zinc ribbon domain-containing protein [Rubrivivax sp.]